MRLSAIRGKCPAYPKAVTSMKRNDLSLQTASLLHSDALIHPAEETQAEARARMTLYRTQQQRGPPALQA